MSQVEVQAPPGPEGLVSGSVNKSAPIERELDEERSHMQVATDKELKENLVREVSQAVREHIESKTSAAVDTLWQRGQKAMKYMQQQQTTQSEQLRGQLAACAESYRNLERENAALRSGLEALMKHLTVAFGPPPHMQPHPPFFTQPSPASAGLPKTSVASLQIDTEDFHTPAVSPLRSPAADELSAQQPLTPQLPHIPGFPSSAADTSTMARSCNADVVAAASASSGGTGSEPAGLPEDTATVVTTATPPSLSPPPSTGNSSAATTFSLTLRRADNVPLGLDLRGSAGESCLVVEAVRPGGAIEAWNRQCAGDTREMRIGDKIILINGASDADSMQEQCSSKYLLRMTVLRGSSADSEQQPDGTLQMQLERSASGSGLRADADEFVPQVGSWASYSPTVHVTSC